MNLVTHESVAGAARAIEAAGGRVSMRNVRAHLGGGSPNAIMTHLNALKPGKSKDKPEVVIDPKIAKAIAAYVEESIAKASAELESQLEEARQDNELLAKEAQEHEESINELRTALEAADKQHHSDLGRIAQLESQVAGLQESLAGKEEAERGLAVAQALLQATEAKASKLEEELAAARVAVREAELDLAKIKGNKS